ncbi:MAG: hypothetical protein ACXIT4_09740 [Erythrobacter sp.]
MLTDMFYPAAHDAALAPDSNASEFEIKSAAALHRPRRTLADRVRSAVMKLAAGRAVLLAHEEKPWASITFSGTRHELVLEFTGIDAVMAGEDLMERLPDHEFTIPGQLVADATITAVDHMFGPEERLTITAALLLLEEH